MKITPSIKHETFIGIVKFDWKNNFWLEGIKEYEGLGKYILYDSVIFGDMNLKDGDYLQIITTIVPGRMHEKFSKIWM